MGQRRSGTKRGGGAAVKGGTKRGGRGSEGGREAELGPAVQSAAEWPEGRPDLCSRWRGGGFFFLVFVSVVETEKETQRGGRGSGLFKGMHPGRGINPRFGLKIGDRGINPRFGLKIADRGIYPRFGLKNGNRGIIPRFGHF